MKGIQEEYEKCKAERDQLELLLKTDFTRNTVNISDLVDELSIDQFNRIVERPLISEKEDRRYSEFANIPPYRALTQKAECEILEICISENSYQDGAKKIRIDMKYNRFYEGDNETPRGYYPSRPVRTYCMIYADGNMEKNCEHDVPYERFRLIDFSK